MVGYPSDSMASCYCPLFNTAATKRRFTNVSHLTVNAVLYIEQPFNARALKRVKYSRVWQSAGSVKRWPLTLQTYVIDKISVCSRRRADKTHMHTIRYDRRV